VDIKKNRLHGGLYCIERKCIKRLVRKNEKIRVNKITFYVFTLEIRGAYDITYIIHAILLAERVAVFAEPTGAERDKKKQTGNYYLNAMYCPR